MPRHLAVVASMAGLTSSALAQLGTATYSIAFGSPSGPNTVILQPGETTQAYVNVSFSIGTPPGLGLSDGAFSISSAGSGTGMWRVDPIPSSATYSLPHPWGAQGSGGLGVSVGAAGSGGVESVIWGYGFFLYPSHPYPQNPANVFRCTFEAATEGRVNVTFAGLGPTGVVLSFAAQWPWIGLYQSSPGIGGTITVVPGVPTLALFGLAGALAIRRRR